jgi:hypothetical protein
MAHVLYDVDDEEAPDVAPVPVPQNIAEPMLATWFDSRLILAILGFAFPFVLWLGGREWAGIELQNSMSAYYHATGPSGRSMSILFTGTLFAVGALLFVQKGFGLGEGLLLKLAAVMAVLVAIFPMCWGDCQNEGVTVHGGAALVFFISVTVVAWRYRKNTLSLKRHSEMTGKAYKIAYWFALALMVGGAGATLAIRYFGFFDFVRSVFIIEACGVVGFALYWTAKTYELRAAREAAKRKAERIKAPAPTPP